MHTRRVLSSKALQASPSHTALSGQYIKRSLSKAAAAQQRTRNGQHEDQHESPRKQQSNDGPQGRLVRNLTVASIGGVIGYAIADFYRGQTTRPAPNAFIKYQLVGKDYVSSTSAVFTIKPAAGTAISLKDVPERAIISVEFKQPQLQIARSYTLLPLTTGQAPEELRFLIRRETKGEVSGYLHRLPIGSVLDFRGPFVDYVLPADVEEVVFLAGGTGIVPAIQVASALSRKIGVHVLWANRRREDCLGGRSSTSAASSVRSTVFGWWRSPVSAIEDQRALSTTARKGPIVGLLDNLKRSSSDFTIDKAGLKIDYFVDEEGTFINLQSVQQMLITSDSNTPSDKKKVLLISGPEGFVEYWAGPKRWVNGKFKDRLVAHFPDSTPPAGKSSSFDEAFTTITNAPYDIGRKVFKAAPDDSPRGRLPIAALTANPARKYVTESVRTTLSKACRGKRARHLSGAIALLFNSALAQSILFNGMQAPLTRGGKGKMGGNEHVDGRTSSTDSTHNVDDAGLENLEPARTNARPSCFRNTFQEMLFVLTATMAIAMTAFLIGSVSVTSSYIGRDLGMTTAELTWLQSAPALAAGSFLLFFGRLADLFGRKSLFVGSLFVFAVLNLGAGFMQSGIGLDIINGVMGLSGASAVPPAIGLLGIVYEKPSKRKNYAFACFSAGNPLGFISGTIFGGIAASIFSWRATYWLIALIFLLFAIIGVFAIPRDFEDKQPLNWHTVKRFDIMGTVLTIAGIGLFSAALSLGDTAPNGWATSYVVAFLVVGVVLIVAFVFWEMWFSEPLVPMHIWLDKNFSLNLAILSLGFASFTPASFFLALYYQNVWNMSPIMVGVHLLPMAVNGIIVNIVAGAIMHRVSNKLIMFIATCSYTVAFLLIAVSRNSSSYWAFGFPSLLLMVVGADLEFCVANMYVMSSMPRHQQSLAGGIFQTVTRLCQTIGLGITTAVFNAAQRKPSLSSYWDRETQPYAAVFWTTFSLAALSIFLVPFMTLGTQGGKKKVQEADETERDVAAQPDQADEKGEVRAEAVPSPT